jgi:streptomycin 6-kinase
MLPAVHITSGLRNTWGDRAEGKVWLADLDALQARAAKKWNLRVGQAFDGSNVSYVAPVICQDGSTAVLKLNFPEPETENEPDALRHWDGHGAVRLIDDDPDLRALLMERLEPGDSLYPKGELASLEVGAAILREFRRPPPAGHLFRALDAVAMGWRSDLLEQQQKVGRSERALMDQAIGWIDDLARSASETVVLHQDLHAGNILDAGSRGWLAIDPKPMVGDPAFDAASLLRDRREELSRDPEAVRRMRFRLDMLAAELDLDRARMRGWAIVHAMAWGVGDLGTDEKLVACARWLAVVDNP